MPYEISTKIVDRFIHDIQILGPTDSHEVTVVVGLLQELKKANERDGFMPALLNVSVAWLARTRKILKELNLSGNQSGFDSDNDEMLVTKSDLALAKANLKPRHVRRRSGSGLITNALDIQKFAASISSAVTTAKPKSTNELLGNFFIAFENQLEKTERIIKFVHTLDLALADKASPAAQELIVASKTLLTELKEEGYEFSLAWWNSAKHILGKYGIAFDTKIDGVKHLIASAVYFKSKDVKADEDISLVIKDFFEGLRKDKPGRELRYCFDDLEQAMTISRRNVARSSISTTDTSLSEDSGFRQHASINIEDLRLAGKTEEYIKCLELRAAMDIVEAKLYSTLESMDIDKDIIRAAKETAQIGYNGTENRNLTGATASYEAYLQRPDARIELKEITDMIAKYNFMIGTILKTEIAIAKNNGSLPDDEKEARTISINNIRGMLVELKAKESIARNTNLEQIIESHLGLLSKKHGLNLNT